VIVDITFHREPPDTTAPEPSLCAGRCRFWIECPRRHTASCTGHVTSLDHVEKHNRVPAVSAVEGTVSSVSDTLVVLAVHGGTLTQNLVTGVVDFTARAAAAVTPGAVAQIDTWQGRGQCPLAAPAAPAAPPR
jgi:hypothetical protein